MRVTNSGAEGHGGEFAELLRLQAEFQARMADETLRYLRRLQGLFAPRAPGTVLRTDESAPLQATGKPGDTVEIGLELENRQRVHCAATPAVTPLIERRGATWFASPDADPPTLLLAPEETRPLVLRFQLPEDLPAGTYLGALMLQGFDDKGVPIAFEVLGRDGPSEQVA